MNESELKQIKLQLAHCMAMYGDNPAELMYKLESLVIEWFEKGLNTSRNPRFEINCPHCQFHVIVGHFEWSALICPDCKGQINR